MTTTKKAKMSEVLQAGAGKRPAVAEVVTAKGNKTAVPKKPEPDTVLIAAHFPPEVRRMLQTLEYKQNRQLKQILGEAINDIAAKYGEPEPFDLQG